MSGSIQLFRRLFVDRTDKTNLKPPAKMFTKVQLLKKIINDCLWKSAVLINQALKILLPVPLSLSSKPMASYNFFQRISLKINSPFKIISEKN